MLFPRYFAISGSRRPKINTAMMPSTIIVGTLRNANSGVMRFLTSFLGGYGRRLCWYYSWRTIRAASRNPRENRDPGLDSRCKRRGAAAFGRDFKTTIRAFEKARGR